MKCSIQLSFASLNRTFHLSPHENNCTIALITIHYLYYISCEVQSNSYCLMAFTIHVQISYLRMYPISLSTDWFSYRPTECLKYHITSCIVKILISHFLREYFFLFPLDVNECEEGTHTCSHSCVNTDGGFTCTQCKPGYQPAYNKTCVGMLRYVSVMHF